jgi:hypothetical protein
MAVAVLGCLIYISIVFVLFPILSNYRHGDHPPVIQNVSAGLEYFKMDWGMYPPSSNRTGGAKEFGYQCLPYYLIGPAGNGWGKPVNQPLPFGGNSENLWGPYYKALGVPEAILDPFMPAKPLLYFRFERDLDPPYDVRDNPVDPTCVNGFASQEQFELLVRPKDQNGNRKWVREDYLLISPGADRCYGYVAEDRATGKVRPARPEEIEKGEAFCDDIVNFRY